MYFKKSNWREPGAAHNFNHLTNTMSNFGSGDSDFMPTGPQSSFRRGQKRRSRGTPLTAKQKGQIASIKFARIAPWADMGAMRVQRGTDENLARFGASFKTASDEQKSLRRSSGYTGRGKYNHLRAGWRAATPYLKRAALSGISAVMGGGLYTEGSGLYRTNNLIAGEGSRPSMTFESSNDETQSLILTHKEYVSDIFGPGSAAFTNVAYPVNPGLSAQFPFLAQFAANFDEYELIQMIFEFHSTVDSSVNTSTGNTGTIIMATNYKSDAQPFLTKEEMIQYHGGVSGRLTDNMHHGVECDPSKNAMGGAKFIRSTPVANSDIKTYDSGIFQLAVQNCPTAFQNNQIGELWVHYKVKLSKPKLTVALGNAATAAKFLSNAAPTFALLMGNSQTKLLSAFNNNFVPLISDQTSGKITITFPAQLSGVFEIVYALEATTVSSTTAVAPVLGGQVSGWYDVYASTGATNPVAGASTRASYYTNGVHISSASDSWSYMIRVKVLQATGGTNNTVTFTPLGSAGVINTGVQASLEIREIGNQFQQTNQIHNALFQDVNGLQVVV